MNCLSFLFLLILCINKSFSKFIDNSVDKVAFLDIQDDRQMVGDAFVIESKGKYAMIDVGYGSSNSASFPSVKKYLEDNGIKQLEWLLITHNHDDHDGGVIDLLNIVDIKKVYTKDYQGYDVSCNGVEIDQCEKRNSKLQAWNNIISAIKSKNIPIKYVTKYFNKTITLGNYKFKLFNTDHAFEKYADFCLSTGSCNENVNSIVAVAKNRKRYYYFSADSENYPTDLVEAYDPNGIAYWVEIAKEYYNIDHFDVFKASRHGFASNNGSDVYQAAKPDICVISTKANKETSNGNATGRIFKRADEGEVNAIPEEKPKSNRPSFPGGSGGFPGGGAGGASGFPGGGAGGGFSFGNPNEVKENILSGNPNTEIYYTGAGTVEVIQSGNEITVNQLEDAHAQ